jgi:hypothetical protein
MIQGLSHLETAQEQTLAQRPGNQESLMQSLAGTFRSLVMALRMSMKRFGQGIPKHLMPGPISSLGSPHH